MTGGPCSGKGTVAGCLRPRILSLPYAVPIGHPHPWPMVLAHSVEVGTTKVGTAASV